MWYENNTIIEVFKAIIIDDVDKLEQHLKSDPKNKELNLRRDDLLLCAVKNNALKCVRALNRKGWKVFPNDGGFNAIITAVK